MRTTYFVPWGALFFISFGSACMPSGADPIATNDSATDFEGGLPDEEGGKPPRGGSGSGGAPGAPNPNPSAGGGTSGGAGGESTDSGATDASRPPPAPDSGSPPDGPGAGGAGGGSAGAGGSGGSAGADVTTIAVRLVPKAGVSGTQRVNFAVPLAAGRLSDPALLAVSRAGAELPAARRVLARHRDGSIRSVQVQVDVPVSGETPISVALGRRATLAGPELVPVQSTLAVADGTEGPRVWAFLPPSWLSASGVVGPQVPEADVTGPSRAWQRLCDYSRYDVGAFLNLRNDPAVWLYDRGTTLYRGHARRGDTPTLGSAYRETSIYRNQISGTGTATRISILDRAGDLKYHYAQNLAIHYLMTGDDRFRESAESIGDRVRSLWPRPEYTGGSAFWTERHAGFALLAYVWTMIVSDDRSAHFRNLADEAVDAYLRVQDNFPPGYTDATARCFAHAAAAHGESFSSFGCSPWMSAILADALDAYATESEPARAQRARQAIVKLGRILAREGRDGNGRPYYWMGVGPGGDSADPYNEHWGESAYIIAMAYHHAGRNDATLRQAAEELTLGFERSGVAPHMRSFNWQCRSAVATPFYLR